MSLEGSGGTLGG